MKHAQRVRILSWLLALLFLLSAVACTGGKATEDPTDDPTETPTDVSTTGSSTAPDTESESATDSDDGTGQVTEPDPVLDGDPISGLYTEIIGNIRVALLSDRALRVEQCRTGGSFCDSETLAVSNRTDWPGVIGSRKVENDCVYLSTATYTVVIPQGSRASKVTVLDKGGNTIWVASDATDAYTYLPAPGETPEVWSFCENPRIEIPPEGVTTVVDAENNGWTITRNARDYYIFVPLGDAFALREDYNRLTGACELVTLKTLGFWFSRYYPYKDYEIIDLIETFREKGYPIDMFVVDTDWRQGASTGYTVNTTLFPNMKRFLEDAHDLNVSIVFNDHVRDCSDTVLTANQLQWFNEQLTAKLESGLDIWWYDRNWSWGLHSPFSEVHADYLGQRLYLDICQAYNAALNRRTVMLSNYYINYSGNLTATPYIGTHRYSVQWSGDIQSSAISLKNELTNMVYIGAMSSAAYLSSDIGGHFGVPSESLFIRWSQFGALSPIMRYHACSLDRSPWVYGQTADKVARAYITMRYRLLPLYYTLAYQNYANGLPIARRLDFYYPQYEESKDNTQYLLGDDILIAPITESMRDQSPVPDSWFTTEDGTPGIKASYYANQNMSGTPVIERIESNISFDWGTGSPDPKVPADGFSAVYEGVITIPDFSTQLGVMSDDGVRLYIDGELIVDNWQASDSVAIMCETKIYTGGSQHTIRVEYYEGMGNAKLYLLACQTDSAYTSSDQIPELVVDTGWLTDKAGNPGLTVTYYNGTSLSGDPIFTANDARVNHAWGTGSPDSRIPADNFSAVWEGSITVGACDVYFGTVSDDGVRLYIDGELIIDNWKASDSVTIYNTDRVYQAGSKHSIRIEYYENAGNAVIRLMRKLTPEYSEGNEDPLYSSTMTDTRTVFIPDGTWINVFTGEEITGPKTISVSCTIRTSPIFVRKGSVLALAYVNDFASTGDWNRMVLDVYVGEGLSDTTMLYEDDGESLDYMAGVNRNTTLTVITKDGVTTVCASPAEGQYTSDFTEREWTLRLHLGQNGQTPTEVTVNGQKVDFTIIRSVEGTMPFAVEGASPDGDVLTVTFTAPITQGFEIIIR